MHVHFNVNTATMIHSIPTYSNRFKYMLTSFNLINPSQSCFTIPYSFCTLHTKFNFTWQQGHLAMSTTHPNLQQHINRNLISHILETLPPRYKMRETTATKYNKEGWRNCSSSWTMLLSWLKRLQGDMTLHLHQESLQQGYRHCWSKLPAQLLLLQQMDSSLCCKTHRK